MAPESKDEFDDEFPDEFEEEIPDEFPDEAPGASPLAEIIDAGPLKNMLTRERRPVKPVHHAPVDPPDDLLFPEGWDTMNTTNKANDSREMVPDDLNDESHETSDTKPLHGGAK